MQFDPRIALTDAPPAGAIEKLVAGLVGFNEEKGGPRNAQPLLVLVSHPDNDEVLGGLYGATVYGQLKIELLYLPESMRGHDVGRKVMEMAESEAERRGCDAAWLETFSFQARGFYERLGYVVFGSYGDFPVGHTLYFMKKALRARTIA
jgi:GNAT superfamily N-acetyltransferase